MTHRISFLANVLAVIRSDGKETSEERAFLATFEKRRKVKKSELKEAERIVRQGYEPMPVGTFAEGVENLEEILRAVLADGKLEPQEHAQVAAFCVKLGITQAQLDRMVSEVQEEALPSVCPACGAEMPAGCSFCPTCGASAETEAVSTAFEVAPKGVTLAFADSATAACEAAIALAKACDRYRFCRISGKPWHLVSFHQASEAFDIAEAMASLRNRKLWVDGEPMEWDTLFSSEVRACIRGRLSAFNAEDWCCGRDEGTFTPFCCRGLGYFWAGPFPHWLTYGSWERVSCIAVPAYRWVFDKEKLRHRFIQDAKILSACSVFNPEIGLAFIDALPDSVTPGRDWEYRHCGSVAPPWAIKVRVKNAYGTIEEFYSDGVRPARDAVLLPYLQMASEALRSR